MNFFDRLNVYFYHNDRQKKWPLDGPKTLGWKDTASQRTRFNAIAQQYDFTNKTVLDLGCGFGDLKLYLDEYFKLKAYTGIDQQKSFIAAAKLRDIPLATFLHADFARCKLNKHDVIIACGSLNYYSSNPKYLYNVIKGMYANANEVVIFNLLNSDTFPTDTLLQSYNPNDILTFCRTLTKQSLIIQGYAADDFTVVMKK
ncbi:class I SAM-dependent methyltransferase [Vibrio tapetis subsp. quintayensis]|uniref:class I SAM-dependent methyltransferase n=1 Tax=Vibrio tapetis TaxID=52443 RepID=UPI0025B53C69|nr:class I SAM-dependent methyltransferase [Vibrio tapetis]MDN3681913.1 class I SAM-dependent methyltransferase [Vibrio tapetis subsp. quintayensis]